jgi:ATP-binding cassette subfamily F protein uup
MSLIRIENISLTFGQTNILNKVNLNIEPHDKIFLIGRNGMGKSCLLKVITGQIEVDSGKIHFQPGLKIATLAQDLPSDQTISIFEFVSQGLEKVGNLLKRYNELTHSTEHDEKWFAAIEEVQRELEINNGWQFQQLSFYMNYLVVGNGAQR